MATISDEQLLAEVEDLLKTIPTVETVGQFSVEYDWLGRAMAVIHEWSPSLAPGFGFAVNELQSRTGLKQLGYRKIVTMLNQCRHSLRMRISGPLAVAVGSGQVFHYFDEIRRKIEVATSDVLFVDPYLNADFVSTYLPHIPRSAAIRLLSRESIAAMKPSVELFIAQTGATVQLRAASGFHDRFVFVDRTTGFHSGASFKDGAKRAPTTISEVTDALPAVLATYEALWSGATPIV